LITGRLLYSRGSRGTIELLILGSNRIIVILFNPS